MVHARTTHLIGASCIAMLVSMSMACQSSRSAESDADAKGASSDTAEADSPASQPASEEATSGQPLADPVPEGMAVATFAGGCFWCMEGPFEKLDGVSEVLSGYTGGPEKHPTYEQVSRGNTGHTEAVRVVYDPGKVGYDKLLDAFWRSMDPTDIGGQFADRGSQYRPAIFTHTTEQRDQAEASKKALAESGRFDRPIIVPVQDAMAFWVAEGYHQDYYLTNTSHYKRYRKGSGREGFLEKVWAK